MLVIFAATLLLGALVGFLAGLLGIGGGLVIVPALVMLLPAFDIVPPTDAIFVAVATSLSSIIMTSTSSVRAHHKFGNVDWSMATPVAVGAAIGAWFVGYFAHHIGSDALQLIFGIAVLLIALRMLGSRSAVGSKLLPAKAVLGSLSALLGAWPAYWGSVAGRFLFRC